MTVGALGVHECRSRLAGAGLGVVAGPFSCRIRSPFDDVAQYIHFAYCDHPVVDTEAGARFSVAIAPARGLRRYVRRQVYAEYESQPTSLTPLPRRLAPPLVEWVLNWCIGNHAHEILVVHAAAVERDGRVLMLPAPPGSGKSTLCVALACRGWRLLSDEFTLIDLDSGAIVPIPRPVAIKDHSIELLRAWAPELVYGPEVVGPGDVRLLYARPPADAVRRAGDRARPGWIVVPGYAADADPAIAPVSRARALVRLAENAFNHTMHGRRGFDLLAAVAGHAPACIISYRDIPSAVALVEQFCAGSR